MKKNPMKCNLSPHKKHINHIEEFTTTLQDLYVFLPLHSFLPQRHWPDLHHLHGTQEPSVPHRKLPTSGGKALNEKRDQRIQSINAFSGFTLCL